MERLCDECGTPLPAQANSKRQFCTPTCRYKARDRRDYEADPEAERAKSRAFYWRNRELVKARRREARRRKREQGFSSSGEEAA